jgi:divalent metal cation (Fe/Co/Zn/Cd) transporter
VTVDPSPPIAPPAAAVRRAITLEYATVAWNVVEVGITVALGLAARSLALVAFGLDSLVEIFASSVVLWHLRGDGRVSSPRTRRALRLVAFAFFGLATVLFAGAVESLVVGRHPDDAPLGIAYLAVTATVMFMLGWLKGRLADEIGNHPLVHEARITVLDGCLATGILLALVANTALGWWWADPIAAIVVAVLAVVEGFDAPREHEST